MPGVLGVGARGAYNPSWRMMDACACARCVCVCHDGVEWADGARAWAATQRGPASRVDPVECACRVVVCDRYDWLIERTNQKSVGSVR